MQIKRYIGFILFFPFISLHSQDSCVPFKVSQLFNKDLPETLGLKNAPGEMTVTVFSPGSSDNKYNNGVVLFSFRGKMYAQWQSSSADEDAGDTQVFYSISNDGVNWENPTVMTEKCDDRIKTSGGWWSDGNILVAFINVWKINVEGSREGYTECITSADGRHWSAPKPVTDINGDPVKGVIEQDIHSLPGGRLLTAFHIQPGLHVTPYYTDDATGITGWKPGKMENLPSKDKMMSREIEPSWFCRSDSAVVMVFRDQSGSFKKLASVSYDEGLTWSMPAIVDTPDSRSKQSAGNLPDGTAFMINNPSGNKDRFPLVITLSRDGFIFDRAFLIRCGGKNLQPMKYNGKYKRPGYHYPKSVVCDGYLYVGYSTNKEDIELTRIPVDSLLFK
jgi:hypothetical protein